MTIAFAKMGFGSEVTPISATPAVDGYFGTLGGLPYGIHPTATPEAYVALVLAIAADTVTVNPYVAPPAPPALTLAQAQAAQATIISNACAAAITSGFTSSALGATYSYPSNNTPQHPDQTNLNASVTRALLASRKAGVWMADTQVSSGALVEDAAGDIYQCVVSGPTGATVPTWPTEAGQIVNDGGAQWQPWTTPFWCADSNGNWAWRDHTAQQIMQVGSDATEFVLAQQSQNASLQAQILAAESPAAVLEIVWTPAP